MRRLGLLLLAVVVGVGCQVDVRVGVHVADDGSGEVRVAVGLDEEARRRASPLDEALVVDDLRDAGWSVSPPEEGPGGRTWLRASKGFTTPEQAGQVLGELTGPDGPFGDLDVERSSSFLSEDWRVEGVVDLADGLAGFADDELRELLGAGGIGIEPDELERLAGRPLREAVRFRLEADLPGGEPRTWVPLLGEATPVEASTTVRSTREMALVAIAALAAVGALVLLGRRR